MKQKRFISLLLCLQFAVLLLFGGFLHQKYAALLHRVEALYTLMQDTKTEVDVLLCDLPVFAPIETIGVEAAHERAVYFMGFGKQIFSHVDYAMHTPKAYQFHARVDGGDLLVAVCQGSGLILHAENPREVQRSHLTADEGLEAAADALSRGGYEVMELTHYETDTNRVIATFAPGCEDTAQVEIIIGLDNGRVMGLFTKPDEA